MLAFSAEPFGSGERFPNISWRTGEHTNLIYPDATCAPLIEIKNTRAGVIILRR